NLPDIVARVDRNGRFVYVNPAVQSLGSIPPEEYLGKSFEEVGVGPDLCRLWREKVETVFATRQPLESEFRWAGPAGAMVFNLRIIPEFQPDGRVDSVLCMARDVTEHKRAEAEIRNLAKFPAESPFPIMRLSAEGEIVYANAASRRLLKKIGAQAPDLWKEVVAESLAMEAARQMEYEAAGRFYSVFVAPSPGEGYVNLYAVNITPQVRAERQAVAARDFYLKLLEEFPNPIWRANRQGECDYCNKTFLDLTGRTLEQMAGKGWLETIHPDDRERVAAINAESYEARRSFLAEFRLRRRDGEYAWLVVFGTPFYDLNGQFAGFIGSCYDITERKAAEEALREATEHLRAVIWASPLAILAYDLDGLITMWNPAAERIFGWTEDEALGRFNPAIPPDQREEFRRLCDSVAHGQTYTGLESHRQRKDGSLIDTSISLATIHDREGRVTGILAVVEDVTGRKKAEQEKERLEDQLRHSQKIEAIGNLTGAIAHDFNNLLSPILGYSELVLMDLKPGAPLHDEVDQIRKAAMRAKDLTGQLLAFGRKQLLELKALDLNALIGDFEKMLRRLVREDIELRFCLGESLGSVRADPSQIEQILLNLAVNAEDAMPEGGRLTIETANVQLDEEYARTHPSVQPGPHVLLAVSDTGSGIDEATQRRIFEPFFTTKERGRGTGLGLATVYGVVKQHGGSIWVYSEVGHGTTFKVYLPRVDEAPEALGAPGGASGVRGSETVLVVEDEPMVRNFVCDVLRTNGYSVIEAENPEDALFVAGQHEQTIDLLVTDVIMPGMNGKELFDKTAAFRPGMKVLYMSGYTGDTIVHHGILDSGIRFIQKPFTVQTLTQKAREALEG
ncbi:MAG: PAS domain S-box protein, partial [Candidatus Sumerlaeota bacterium]|nr:PAS domain S-box protein [Candidatus Sumerlaeota bacterium]